MLDDRSRDKLIKCLELTRSESEGEALNAIRKANDIRTKAEMTWDALIVHDPLGPWKAAADFVKARANSYQPPPFHAHEESPTVAEMFDELAHHTMPDKTEEFIAGLEDFYATKGFLTEKQKAALQKTYERYCG